jgi:hypothetical protein
MKLIETKTLASAAADITFTSIPQTYTDLLVLVSGRTSWNSSEDGLVLSFNGLNTNQNTRRLFSNGFGAQSSNTGYLYSPIAGNGATANTFSNNRFYIPNYSGAISKAFSIDGVYENNATAAITEISAALWNSTAAITSIRFQSINSVNLLAGTTISLYGITKGSISGITVS